MKKAVFRATCKKTLKVQDNIPNDILTSSLRYGEYRIALVLIAQGMKFDHFF